MLAGLINKLKRSFPLKRSDLRLFVPLALLFFLLAFVYNLLRPLKMTLVVVGSQAGAEVIPFLKLWGVLPTAFFFTFLFTQLAKRLSRENTFYAFTAIFLAFFLCFLFFLFPYRQELALERLPALLSTLLPSGAAGFISMIRYWHLSLFYLLTEIWSPIMMSVLFWGFANEVSTVSQAAKLYALINVAGNLSAVVAGKIGLVCSEMNQFPAYCFGADEWEQMIFLIVGIGILTCLAIMAIFRFLCHSAVFAEKPSFENSLASGREAKSKRPSFTLRESFREVSKSRYLLCICTIVVSYNLVFNLTDVLWTDQLKLHFTDSSRAFNAYLSKVTMVKGFMATILGLFMTHLMIKRMGWRFAALFTPVCILATSLIFFPLVIFQQDSFLGDVVYDLWGTSLLSFSVLIGGLQNSLTRAAKYSVYDTTKEMTFIPLSVPMQRKAKAVIDGIASRLGKSGGSLIYQILLLTCTSLATATPYVIVVTLIITVLWVYAVMVLDRELKIKTQ